MKIAPPKEPSALLTMAEAADMLRCCIRTLYLLRDAGKLTILKQRRTSRIARAELQRYVSSLQAASDADTSTKPEPNS